MSYLFMAAMSPLLPYRLESLGVGLSWATPVTAVWMVARVVVVYALRKSEGWHGRWLAVVLGAGAMFAGVAGVLLAPSLGGLIGSFTWLFGTEPLHMGGTSVRAATAPQTANIEMGTPSTVQVSFIPDSVSVVETVIEEMTPAAGYRFPMACGFPRWHSRNGGYGYEDARDWTHVGVDLYAYEGTPVVAPVNGLVLVSGYGNSAGWNVRIEDATGRLHILMHLENRASVATGQRVRSGQTIGTVGRTGNASGGGPHIHYEIRDGDHTIDPMPWLRATGSTFVSRAASDFHTGTAPVYSDCEKRA